MTVKSIKVSREVHQRLTDLASKNETYNEVILRLLETYDTHKKLRKI